MQRSLKAITQRNYSKQKSVSNVEYQYLQRSKLPTMHFQKSLPRLPIPKLSKTCERYMNAIKPLLNNDQYAKAERRTTDFLAKEGKILQEKLIYKDKMNKHKSYVSEFWFDHYLKDRSALPTNNIFIVFHKDKQPVHNEQLVIAANMLIHAVRFMMSLREQILEPEVYHLNPKKSDTQLFRAVTELLPEAVSWYGAYLFKGLPLDMSQFPGLFGATRIPQLTKDKISRDPTSKHVLVQKNGHFYVFDVLDKNGNILSPTELLGNLARIMDDSTPKSEYPLGILQARIAISGPVNELI